MIRCVVKGDFKKTTSFLNRIRKLDLESILKKYGEDGVKALSSATPRRTGRTAESWVYKIEKDKNSISIYWTNTNIQHGIQIAVILELGHGTNNGGYVQGRHYIAPAIRPIFDQIAEAAWKEVASK